MDRANTLQATQRLIVYCCLCVSTEVHINSNQLATEQSHSMILLSIDSVLRLCLHAKVCPTPLFIGPFINFLLISLENSVT